MMTDSLTELFRMGWPPIATYVGGSLAMTTIDVSPEIVYPLLGAAVVSIWRFATFVKGVQEAIKSADSDRRDMAQSLEKIHSKINEQSRKVAVIEAGCPVAQSKRGTCNPFPPALEH